MSNVHTELKARRAELAIDEQKAAEAHRLAQQAEDMGRELADHKRRRDVFAALGDEHFTVPVRQHVQGLGLIQFTPLESMLSGTQLAAQQQAKVDHIQAQIDARKAQVRELLSKPAPARK